tara:strand:- start:101 stop:1093 length:993 start_codon:yes stop_codon:yes gene_type:complete
MKAIQFSKPGPPEVLCYTELPLPLISEDEILVRTHHIGVCIPDTLIRSGLYPWAPPLPTIPGIEASGIVEMVGKNIRKFSIGDQVIVSAREKPERCGCYAEFISARENEAYSVPSGASMEAAACLANYQVAYQMLHKGARIAEGDSILIYGAAGGVGSASVELSRLNGLNVIGVASDDEKLSFIKEIGAHFTIDRRHQEVGQAVMEITDGSGVDLILDPIGGVKFIERLGFLAPMGLLLCYGRLEGYPEGDLLKEMVANMGRSPAVRNFSMHSFDNQPDKRMEAMNSIIDLLSLNKISPRISNKLPLSEATKAHQLLESGTAIGKIILQP